MLAASGLAQESLRKIVERLGRDLRQADLAGLRPARHLPPRRMEFAVAGQNPKRLAGLPRAGRHQPNQVIMRIGCEDNRRRIARAKLRRDMGLGLGPDLAHHLVPLIVGQGGRVLPAFDLPFEARRRATNDGYAPRNAAAQDRRRGSCVNSGLKLKVQPSHNSVLSDQSSGKARLPERARQIGARLPIRLSPSSLPMIRSTVSICLCRQAASASSRSTSFSASW